MINPLRPILDQQGFVVLDGGLATELEARGADLDHFLWSARLLAEAPDLRSAMAVLCDQADEFFSRDFLLSRPLLAAILAHHPVVLLIDEVDRADEEFEAFLLEVLSDYQVSIPELGTIRARRRPRVVLTSNDTRELSDALRRRCLYLYIGRISAFHSSFPHDSYASRDLIRHSIWLCLMGRNKDMRKGSKSIDTQLPSQ